MFREGRRQRQTALTARRRDVMFSMVIPSFEQGSYIKTAISSVLSQGHPGRSPREEQRCP